MGRKCSICSHPQINKINEMLVTGIPLTEITSVFNDITEMSLMRHRDNHLPKTLSKAQEAREMAEGDAVMGELKRCFERVNLLFDACDRWLRDPDNPSRYDLSPRTEDIKVIYEEFGSNGKPVRRKVPLSRLLAKAEGAGYLVQGWETKHADPRELILKTANRLQGQIELMAKLMGELPPEKILIQYEPIIESIILVLRQEVQDPNTLQRISQKLLHEAEGGTIDV